MGDETIEIIGNDETIEIIENDETINIIGNDETIEIIENNETIEIIENDEIIEIIGNDEIINIIENDETIEIIEASVKDFSYVNEGEKLYLDGPGGTTYLVKNATTKRVELWVEGVKQSEWGTVSGGNPF